MDGLKVPLSSSEAYLLKQYAPLLYLRLLRLPP